MAIKYFLVTCNRIAASTLQALYIPINLRLEWVRLFYIYLSGMVVNLEGCFGWREESVGGAVNFVE